MKHVFTLVLACLCATSFGQKAWQQATHNCMVNSLLQQQQRSAHVAMKSTAGISMQRVIAQSTRDNTLATLNDSVNLKYAPNMGSTYDYNTMLFPYNYPYNTSPMFNFAGVFTSPQVLCDTYRHWTVDPNTLVYGYYETGLSTWDASRNLTGYRYTNIDSATNPNMRYTNRFDTGHRIDSSIICRMPLGVPDTTFKQYFAYNTAGKLVKDSMYEKHLGVFRIVSRTFYTYDGSGNLIQIDNWGNTTDTSFLLPLVKQIKYVNTYDGSNRLLTVLDSTYNGTILAQNQKDTFAYTGTFTFHTSWKQYQYDNINVYWAPMFWMTKHLNIGGRPDTVNIQGFDSLLNSWVPGRRQLAHYNSYNDPDTLQEYIYDFTAFPLTPDFTTIYYYQTYLNTLGQHNIATAPQVTIFPNPAAGELHLAATGIADGAPLTLSFVNMSGQVVAMHGLPWHSGTSVSVSDLAPATYIVVVQDAGGTILHRQTIVKQ